MAEGTLRTRLRYERRLQAEAGMADTGYHVPEGSWHRIAQPMADPTTGKLPDQPDVRHPAKLVSGQGNMVGTAIDYLRFAQMMLNGGVLDGVRVLGAGTVAHMTSDHLGPISRNTESARRLIEPGYSFGLGRLHSSGTQWMSDASQGDLRKKPLRARNGNKLEVVWECPRPVRKRDDTR